ncbi:SDR family NAD(P)-dependent oxidoreductase [Auritidibacter ignavus]|uniref:SDR family NAD(P)-dependent oxidoreductase n=1 Tax=Auritidibacter ignavus TaxID=678932 RepID=A0AAJ6DBG2_9MICC|nr:MULTISPECIES: SDR family NAD(P)-dependent oxidoreductase [Auritidibacter]AXR74521.1 SDR family NAD(P)-dependent oxidoreductase [Auritidibacter sp. NML130574]WGH81051.1 SDR family NAD(P)-dependent oxidoreductase [Auritidibacter ignavus]WGH85653.1 SDR family NAD(P)-dependent oxidoreductase [Auritidibacter ignavus]WGH87942.1 SDR family NAD(P)-dependent oxidoreductase [Auritidibacter ignavus]WGH90241.1 SDR family NAD(P)-dependent oxidoreductase [Auritidibacter ignavus]
MEFSQRSFIVTGGGSGLGAATAGALASRGAQVILADLKGEDAENRTFVKTDVTDEDQVQRAIEVAQSTARLSGLVNCAGIAIAQKAVSKGQATPLADFAKVVNINLIGTYNTTRLFAEAIHTQEPDERGERGLVVNTASVAAFDGQIGQPAYAASKGGVASMTLPLARELARHAIRVVTIAPGIFKTPMMASLPQEAQDSLAKAIPFPQRLGEPSEYAQLVLHLWENQILNGEVIRLDGAIRMQP